jgi:outer membrane protein TolC
MSRSLVRALALSLCCAAFVGVRAEEPAAPPAFPAKPTLTLEDCIARALQKNFALKIESFSTDVARENLKAAQAQFEPTFTASAQRSSVQQSPVIGNDRIDTFNARIGVTELIPTGAEITVSSALDRNARNYGSSYVNGGSVVNYGFNPVYNSDVSLTVTQPLLRGAGFAVNRATIERNRLGVGIARLNFKGSVLQVVRDTETAYFNLVFAREQLAVKEHSLRLAERLYEENKVRKLTGVATDLDVLSAEVGIATARNGVVTAQQAVRNSEDALTALTGQFEFDQPVGTVALLPYQEPSPSFDLSYKLARENQPDFLVAQRTIQQLQIDARTAKNSVLPSLNVGGSAGYNGIDRGARAAVDNLSNGEAHSWELDVTLSVPWGLHAGRARYRAALAGVRQQETRLQQLDQNLLVQVRSSVRAVETNQQSVEINRKATELATRQYELELARFKAGLATSRQVLQVQDDLETARVNELAAEVNLRIAIANLHQLESSSLQRYHINLAE